MLLQIENYEDQDIDSAVNHNVSGQFWKHFLNILENSKTRGMIGIFLGPDTLLFKPKGIYVGSCDFR